MDNVYGKIKQLHVSKILHNFNEVVPKNYKVKLPIFSNTEMHLPKELKNELNVQYSNICYIKLTN